MMQSSLGGPQIPVSSKNASAPDARAYLANANCMAFLQAVADGNERAVEEFHNTGVGIVNKVRPVCL
jgi:hypothetical protein